MAYPPSTTITTSAIPSSNDDLREKTQTLEVKTSIDTEPIPDKPATEIKKTEEEKETELEPSPMNEK